MILWLRVGEQLCGVEQGLLRAADVSTFMETLAFNEEMSRRREADLDATNRQADALRGQAERDARATLQAASDEAEALRLDAIARGREEGRQAALDDWHARRLEGALERAASLERLRELLVELVVSGVERIVGSEAVPALFSKALAEVQTLLQGARTATLRIHGSDLAAAEAALSTAVHRDAPILVVVDASLQPGACVFESDWGCVDAGLHTQLQALRVAMADSVYASAADGAQAPPDASAHDDAQAFAADR